MINQLNHFNKSYIYCISLYYELKLSILYTHYVRDVPTCARTRVFRVLCEKIYDEWWLLF